MGVHTLNQSFQQINSCQQQLVEMFRTMNNPSNRQDTRQRQSDYQKELDKQVNTKQQQKVQEMARKHAEKYSQQFGLVNKIAAAPDSGFSVSPRYNQQPPPRPEYDYSNNRNNATGFGGNGGLARTRPNNTSTNNNVGQRNRVTTGQELNDRLTMDLESRFTQISKAFLAADVDRSGSLEVGELRRLCQMYNLPTERVER